MEGAEGFSSQERIQKQAWLSAARKTSERERNKLLAKADKKTFFVAKPMEGGSWRQITLEELFGCKLCK